MRDLELVSDQSSLGTQFLRGFGGLGGLLRWTVDFDELNGHNVGTLKDGDDEESSKSTGSEDWIAGEDDPYRPDGPFAKTNSWTIGGYNIISSTRFLILILSIPDSWRSP